MPHRKLVQIGASPKLPTIAEFFKEMAGSQKDEISRLKREAQEAHQARDPLAPANGEPSPPKKVAPYPWLLHPVKKPKRKVSRKETKK